MFVLSPVVSAMLPGVACMASYVAGAPMCITDTFFFACGGILRHSDVLIGPPGFLLGGRKKVISLLSSGWASDFWPGRWLHSIPYYL